MAAMAVEAEQDACSMLKGMTTEEEVFGASEAPLFLICLEIVRSRHPRGWPEWTGDEMVNGTR